MFDEISDICTYSAIMTFEDKIITLRKNIASGFECVSLGIAAIGT
jgi:hypothetical protein